MLLGTALTWAPPATACSCAGPPAIWEPAVELDGSDAPVRLPVPANGKLWVSERLSIHAGIELRWVRRDESVVDGHWTRLSPRQSTQSDGVLVFHPAAPLTVGEELQLQRPQAGNGWAVIAEVPVVEADHQPPPPPPALVDVTWTSLEDYGASSCALPEQPRGRTDVPMVQFDLGLEPAGQRLLVMQLGSESALSEDAVDGVVDVLGPEAAGGGAQQCSAGPWVFDLEAGPTRARWGRYDIVGRFSGWSEWTTIPPPANTVDDEPLNDDSSGDSNNAQGSGGCQGSGGPMLAGLVGAAVLLRRRRGPVRQRC